MRRVFAVFIALSMVLQTVLPTVALAQGDRFEVTITARSLNVRSGPGTDFDILASVKQGDQVLGLREDSGWVQIELNDGTIGWVSNRYVSKGAAVPATPPPPPVEDRRDTPPPPPQQQERRETYNSGSSGGTGFGGILKWTTFLAAAGLGSYAVYERLQGNDTFDEYEALALAGDDEAAEVKWEETADHDDKAKLYGIVAGGLFGLFLVQHLIGGGGNDSASLSPAGEPSRLAFDPGTGEFRANVFQIRF